VNGDFSPGFDWDTSGRKIQIELADCYTELYPLSYAEPDVAPTPPPGYEAQADKAAKSFAEYRKVTESLIAWALDQFSNLGNRK
jgi:hypothetical protein